MLRALPRGLRPRCRSQIRSDEVSQCVALGARLRVRCCAGTPAPPAGNPTKLQAAGAASSVAASSSASGAATSVVPPPAVPPATTLSSSPPPASLPPAGQPPNGVAAAHSEKPLRWPLVAGGIAVTGMLGAGMLLHFDGTLEILQPTHEHLQQDEDEEGQVELGVGNLASMCVAYCVAALPIDDLKMRLLRGGALTYWSVVTGLGERGHELISLNSMNDLLSGDSGLRLFHTDPDAYALLCDSMLATCKPQDVLGSRVSLDVKGRGHNHLPEILALGSTLASHPSFRGASGDERFWIALLEGGEASMDEKPELAPVWSCIAYACAERPRLARRMFFDVNVKRRLLQLSEEPDDAEGLQSGYAAAALHRLALAAAAEEGSPMVSLGVKGRMLEEFLERPPPNKLPVRPMSERSPDDLGVPSRLALAAIGGFAWALVRCVRKAVRTSKPVRLTLLSTAVGATAFQAFQEVDLLVHKHLWISAFGSESSPNFQSISSFTVVTAGEFAVSFGLLWALLQPGRAPFAFGGWVVGQVLGIDLD